MIECNAVITKASFDTERGLSAWLMLNYGGHGGQGFGGYLLYIPANWDKSDEPKPIQPNYCGHFIYRVLTIAGVDDWAKLVGRSIRVRKEDHWNGPIRAIGHIIEDDWFDPKVEFATLREAPHV